MADSGENDPEYTETSGPVRIQYRPDTADTFNQLTLSLYHAIQDHFQERCSTVGRRLTIAKFREFLERLRVRTDAMVDFGVISAYSAPEDF
jgi:hypothetical protein